MKTTYKADRGHVIHVVHETKSKVDNGTCWTLCGEYFHSGTRDNKTPTCPKCLKYDNPLLLTPRARGHLSTVAAPADISGFNGGRGALEELIRSDYLDHDGTLTRRGAILAEDFILDHGVPLPDGRGLMHARSALYASPKCDNTMKLPDAHHMTTRRYGQLRKIEDDVLITCLRCLTLQ